jgi:hypothetical protein
LRSAVYPGSLISRWALSVLSSRLDTLPNRRSR